VITNRSNNSSTFIWVAIIVFLYNVAKPAKKTCYKFNMQNYIEKKHTSVYTPAENFRVSLSIKASEGFLSTIIGIMPVILRLISISD
jgi:hypothetical protein